MAERDILICTVGTSLLTNIDRLGDDELLKVCRTTGNMIGLVKELLRKDPLRDRICGAEINSITSLISKKKIGARSELHLMVSDTADGQEVGGILKSYYEEPKNPYRFERAISHRVPGLRDDDVKRFKNEGLRNLVKQIASLVRERGTSRVLINATGGYKAQISFAGLIGQALEVPVLYMFERFAEVIELPPQPLSFDFKLWLANYESFDLLATKEVAPYEEVKALADDERIRVLIEEETINSQRIVALTAMGQLFHEGFFSRFFKERKGLLPADLSDAEREPPRFSDHFRHHPPLGAENLVRRFWEEKKYIKTIRDFYTNPDLPERNRLVVDSIRGKLVFTYSDGTRTVKFNLEIPGGIEITLRAALIDVTQSYPSIFASDQ